MSLLIDSPTAPPPRVTYDVDLIAEVAALRHYHALEKAFAQRGFKRDMSPDAPICRWIVGSVKVDLMPTTETVLGFSNTWYVHHEQHADMVRWIGGVFDPKGFDLNRLNRDWKVARARRSRG